MKLKFKLKIPKKMKIIIEKFIMKIQKNKKMNF